MTKLGFHLIGKSNEDFESCLDCVHASDSEEICTMRKCVHAIKFLYDCYEKAERKTGKWISKAMWYVCSECNMDFDSEIAFVCDGSLPDYCPNCGAKMEVQDDNN